MKKKVKLIVIIIIAFLLLAVVYRFIYVGDEKIDTGTYEVIEFDKFPKAYAVVDEDAIQFYNIDLNSIYQTEQIKQYEEVCKVNPDLSYSEEEVKAYSDLNNLMVKNAYNLQYDKQSGIKTGTFKYTYFLYPGSSMFGLVIEYDSFHKTLHINNESQEITFKK